MRTYLSGKVKGLLHKCPSGLEEEGIFQHLFYSAEEGWRSLVHSEPQMFQQVHWEDQVQDGDA